MAWRSGSSVPDGTRLAQAAIEALNWLAEGVTGEDPTRPHAAGVEAVRALRERVVQLERALKWVQGYTKAGPTRNEYDAVIYAHVSEALSAAGEDANDG